MINGINFYSKVDIGVARIFSRVHLFRQKVDDVFKVDYILEFLKKTLLFETSAGSAGLAGDATSACACLSFPGVSWSKACNGSDRTSCMQQQCADCLAEVFSVTQNSCNFVILGQITE